MGSAASVIPVAVKKSKEKERTKCCNKCSKILPLSRFAINKRAKDGRKGTCKECINSERREKNKKKDPTTIQRPTEKKCTQCKKILPASQFVLSRTESTGLSSQCKKCKKEHRQKASDWKTNKKKEGKCATCGYNEDYRALDFAHIDRSSKSTKADGNRVCMGEMYSIKRLEAEWPKVKLLCKNCHRLETWEENKELCEERKDTLSTETLAAYVRIGKRQEFVNTEKLRRGSCLRCELKVSPENLQCFDFDHRNQLEKNDMISAMVRSASIERIEAEMKLCDLLCAICHHIKTYDNGESGQSGRNGHKKRKLERMEAKKKAIKAGEVMYTNFIKSLTEENKKLLLENVFHFNEISDRQFYLKCKFTFSDGTFYRYKELGFIDRYYNNLE